MSQSNFIALFLFAAFIVFITLRGELPKYLGLLIPAKGATAPAGTVTASPLAPATAAPAASAATSNPAAIGSLY
jgi:hypothetical protein